MFEDKQYERLWKMKVKRMSRLEKKVLRLKVEALRQAEDDLLYCAYHSRLISPEELKRKECYWKGTSDCHYLFRLTEPSKHL